MTDEAYTNVRQNLTARARDLTNAAWKEATTWDAFKWTLVGLLAANFLLVALLYGDIRSEIADLKEDRGASDLANVRAEIGNQITDMKAGITQAMSDMQSGFRDDVAKISAKLDKLSLKPSVQQAPKPAAKPRRQ